VLGKASLRHGTFNSGKMPSPPNSPLKIATLEESDIDEFVRMQIAAFPSQTARILYAPSAETAEIFRLNQRKMMKEDPSVYFQKVIEPDTGDIMACARWKIYPVPRDECEIQSKKPATSDSGPKKWQDRAKEAFHMRLHDYMRDVMGTQPLYRMSKFRCGSRLY
jgi:hypothetical protein